MSNTVPSAFLNLFPLTAPDIAWNASATSFAGDMDEFATETTSELQNLQQDLGNRLVELPGSNLDFGPNNTRGIGILLYLSCDYQTFQGLPARIDAEFIQDFRVTSSQTNIIEQAPGSDYPFVIYSQVESVAGVFGLAWGWSQTGVTPLPPGST